MTLGYKGRLLLDFTADQPMAHTAGPDASVASVVVDFWNWVTAHAARANDGKDKVFDQLSPSLRRFITSTNDQMHDTVDGQFAAAELHLVHRNALLDLAVVGVLVNVGSPVNTAIDTILRNAPIEEGICPHSGE